jgi:quercetin dioxygenase-like cupin family protein
MNSAFKKGALLSVSAAWLGVVPSTMAQDAIKADPKHYKVESENDDVRILRVVYGPGEKSPMHDHRAYVAVFLTDGGPFRFTMKDGKTQTGEPSKRGSTVYAPAEAHAVEYLGKERIEFVLI